MFNMIQLFHTSDPGLLVKTKTQFLQQNTNHLIINGNSYHSVFSQIGQDNFFASYDSYLIENAMFLGTQWSHMFDAVSDLKKNEQQIGIFYELLAKLNRDHINILITVHDDKLLQNSKLKKILSLLQQKKEPQIALLNEKTKKTYINELFKQNKIKVEIEHKKVIFDFFPKNAEFINEVFSRVVLLNKDVVTLQDWSQLIGVHNNINFFKLFDLWLSGDVGKWVDYYHINCYNNETLNAFYNIFVYKLHVLFHYCQLRALSFDNHKIAYVLKQQMFSLVEYDKFYNHNKLRFKISEYIIKFYKYSSRLRTVDQMTAQNFKAILLEFLL